MQRRSIGIWSVLCVLLLLVGCQKQSPTTSNSYEGSAAEVWNENWRTYSNLLSTLIQTLGAGIAAWYFLVKRDKGYHLPKLSLSTDCSRQQIGNTDVDWLVINISLEKHERGSIELHSIEARIREADGSGVIGDVNLTAGRVFKLRFDGVTRFADMPDQPRPCPQLEKYKVNWELFDCKHPLVNITPGEKSHTSALLRVSHTHAYHIHIVVLGHQIGEKDVGKLCLGQWQCSIVSLPSKP